MDEPQHCLRKLSKHRNGKEMIVIRCGFGEELRRKWIRADRATLFFSGKGGNEKLRKVEIDGFLLSRTFYHLGFDSLLLHCLSLLSLVCIPSCINYSAALVCFLSLIFLQFSSANLRFYFRWLCEIQHSRTTFSHTSGTTCSLSRPQIPFFWLL